MSTTPIDLAGLRAAVIARSRDRTHCPECYLWSDHRDCAIMALLDRLAAASAVIEKARHCCAVGRQDLLSTVEAYDRAIAGQQEGTTT